MEKKRFIEACINGHISGMEAQKGGASRAELCAALPEGGTTPSYGEICRTVSMLDIPVNVIIRPRGGDFLYTRSEAEVMLADIRICRQAGAAGVVIGALTKYGEIDTELCRILVKEAEGMDITFHRAFDMAADPFRAAEAVMECGCRRILTSGQAPTAREGAELISRLIARYGNRITVMPGCGINDRNIAEIERITGAHEFHMSGKTETCSEMVFRNPKVSMGGTVHIDEYKKTVTSSEMIHRAVTAE